MQLNNEIIALHVVKNLNVYFILFLLIVMSCHYYAAIQDIRLVCGDRPEVEVVSFNPKTLKEKADSICEDYTTEYDLPDN